MICALTAAALIAAAKPTPPSSAPATPSLAVVFRVAPPASDEESLAAADVALRAPEEIGEPIRALRGHPHAHLTFVIEPAYLNALDRAASGDTALSAPSVEAASSGEHPIALLEILARHRPLDSTISRSRAGSQYLTFATAAANVVRGDRSVAFSAQDLANFAATDAAVVLSETGMPQPESFSPPSALLRALADADKAVADELRADVRSGAVEIAATPDDEPVLPLIIDAGGTSATDARIINLAAATDAGKVTIAALRAASAFAHPATGLGVGFYSPFGAYDDATGPIIKNAGAAYALFSDRVVRGSGSGSQSGVDEAAASSLHAYALTVDRKVTLPVLFWSEDGSAAVQTALGATGAMSQQLIAVASQAAQRARGASTILVLRIDAEGPWSQRSDARTVIERFVGTIASGSAGTPTAPAQFLHAHPATASAYGYPAAAESGSLGLWMGSVDQASLWRALAAARTAAGGDSAIDKPKVRPLLVAAESGVWFESLGDPMGGVVASRLAAFRALIAGIYRAVDARVPDNIAPVKAETAGPSPSPASTGSPGPAPSPGSTPLPVPNPKPSSQP
ncbi:MAG TPA: hypothetical protein VID24_07710 [Candidatus Eremiobacteraceae bacterium]